jgi:hypothetical protein
MRNTIVFGLDDPTPPLYMMKEVHIWPPKKLQSRQPSRSRCTSFNPPSSLHTISHAPSILSTDSLYSRESFVPRQARESGLVDRPREPALSRTLLGSYNPSPLSRDPERKPHVMNVFPETKSLRGDISRDSTFSRDASTSVSLSVFPLPPSTKPLPPSPARGRGPKSPTDASSNAKIRRSLSAPQRIRRSRAATMCADGAYVPCIPSSEQRTPLAPMIQVHRVGQGQVSGLPQLSFTGILTEGYDRICKSKVTRYWKYDGLTMNNTVQYSDWAKYASEQGVAPYETRRRAETMRETIQSPRTTVDIRLEVPRPTPLVSFLSRAARKLRIRSRRSSLPGQVAPGSRHRAS